MFYKQCNASKSENIQEIFGVFLERKFCVSYGSNNKTILLLSQKPTTNISGSFFFFNPSPQKNHFLFDLVKNFQHFLKCFIWYQNLYCYFSIIFVYFVKIKMNLN